MFLGIEIGGTKLQLGISPGDGKFVDFRKLEVHAELGAKGICQQIEVVGRELVSRYHVQRIGIGFGGPVDSSAGQVITSHQVEGWDGFPLVPWCQRTLGVATVIGNDCDVASLAEARFGAGCDRRSVFYVTVGTGVGGGCVIDRRLLGAGRPAIAEIGHLRPGPNATEAHQTVESLASGWGISNSVRRMLGENQTTSARDADDLLTRCQHDLKQLTALAIADAARRGNRLAAEAIDQACRVLGWGIAQAITLLAPEVVVIGGGVSLMGEELFFRPVRNYVGQFVFPPLLNSYAIVPAQLGEQVVVHGAICLALDTIADRPGTPVGRI